MNLSRKLKTGFIYRRTFFAPKYLRVLADIHRKGGTIDPMELNQVLSKEDILSLWSKLAITSSNGVWAIGNSFKKLASRLAEEEI